MKKHTKIILGSLTALMIVLIILFLNKLRLDASTERITNKPSVVSIAPVERKPIQLKMSLIEVLRAFNDVPVIAETQGKVLKCYANVGDYIHAGDPIVKVDTLLKYAAFIAAKTAFVKAESDLSRFKALYEQGNLSDNELELANLNFHSTEAQYLVAKKQYEDALICAPISGEIAERSVDEGMIVAPGSPVAVIVDITRLKVIVAVAENRISGIRKGMTVDISTAAHPGKIYTGTVKYIGPKAGESLLFPVEIIISNDRKNPLKAGMTAQVYFNQTSADYALLIPRTALMGSSREGKVFVIKDNIAHIRPVIVGGESGSDIEIISGLQEGEEVVIVGTNTINDGAQVVPTK